MPRTAKLVDSSSRASWLVSLVSRLPRRPRCAEVGVLRGTFAKQIEDILKPSAFYLVDTWRPWPRTVYADYQDYSSEQWEAMYDAVLRRFPWATVWRLPSVDGAAKLAASGAAPLDFVYLDCNHAYESIRADIAAWAPLVRPGGIMAGHDYELSGVTRAVQEYRASQPVQVTPDVMFRTWWWQV